MNPRVAGLRRILLATVVVCSLASSRSGAEPRAAAALPMGQNIPNLEGYWPLDANNAGITPDLSANANDGTLTGGAAIDTTTQAPVTLPPTGNVASLKTDATAATQEFVNVPASLANAGKLQISGPITLAGWVFPTVNTGTGVGDPVNAQKCIIEKWVNGTSGINGYFLRLTSSSTGNNTPLFSRGSGAAENDAQAASALPLSTWAHVAGVFDGTNMILYVNGNAVTTIPSSANPTAANNADLHLAKDYGANVFTGNIDEARVYSFGATAGQVATLISGTQPTPTGTAAAAGPQQVTITWTAAANARSYNIYQSINGGPFTLIGNTSALTFTDTSATNTASMYSYEVTAVACLESSPDPATGTPAVSPGPVPPHVAGHQSNNLAHRCGCDTIPAESGQWIAILALGFLFALRKRPAA